MKFNEINSKRLISLFASILLFSATLFLLIYNLDKQKIQRWDESTNIQVISEISESHSIFLTLNYEPFLEKPPLWYFLSFGAVNIIGENLVAYRIVTVLSGLSVIIFSTLISKKLYGDKGALITWLSFLSNLLLFLPDKGLFFTHTFRTADVDALFIALIVGSIYFLINKETKFNNQIAGILAGLAVLTKGPLGLLPVVSFLIYEIAQKKSVKSSISPLLISLVTSIPWHFVMILKYGELFIEEYFGYHLFSRGITSIEGHSASITLYFEILSPFLIACSIFIPFIVYYLYKNRENQNEQFLKINSVIVVLILVILQTKLPWYFLLIFPFTSIFSGSLMKIKNFILKNILLTIFIIFFFFNILRLFLLIYRLE